MARCLTGTRPLSVFIMTIYIYSHEINYMCGIEMAVPATFECHKQADISGWLDMGLQYLQCISNGDAPVWHQAIDIVHGLWP